MEVSIISKTKEKKDMLRDNNNGQDKKKNLVRLYKGKYSKVKLQESTNLGVLLD